MAAPTDSARVASSTTTAGASHTINVGSPTAGTLLIVFIRFCVPTGGVTFSGYTPLVSITSPDAADDETAIYYRWADGAEGATDALSTVNNTKMAAITWEITGAENPAVSVPTVSTVATGTTTANSANPNSVAPAGAPRDTLYLAMAGGDGEVGAYTNFPTNYANLQAANSGTGGTPATNCFIGGASRALTASSSEDPGAFTHGAHNAGWSAYTVAIRDPTASTPHTANPSSTLSLTDARALGQGKAAADSISLTDARAFGPGKGFADAVALADEATPDLEEGTGNQPFPVEIAMAL